MSKPLPFTNALATARAAAAFAALPLPVKQKKLDDLKALFAEFKALPHPSPVSEAKLRAFMTLGASMGIEFEPTH